MAPEESEHDGNAGAAQTPSKSQRKREALEVRSLAAGLLQLSASQLRRIPLDDDVLAAIREAHRFKSHGARRRQLQYITKLMRRADTADINAALAEIQCEARALTARQHRVEAWRDLLLDQGDDALGELLNQHREVDVQYLRQLIRNARLEETAGKPPAAARALFRALRDLDSEQNLPPCR
jgi:ribosome-associated protein